MSDGAAEAVLFDFDGVLVDRTRAVESAWEQWAGEHGVDRESLRAVVHGRRTEQIVELLSPDLDPDREAAWVERTVLTIDDGGLAIDGAAGREVIAVTTTDDPAELLAADLVVGPDSLPEAAGTRLAPAARRAPQ